jgi:hypothetical protein
MKVIKAPKPADFDSSTRSKPEVMLAMATGAQPFDDAGHHVRAIIFEPSSSGHHLRAESNTRDRSIKFVSSAIDGWCDWAFRSKFRGLNSFSAQLILSVFAKTASCCNFSTVLIPHRHLAGLDRFLIPHRHLAGLDRFLIPHRHLAGLDRFLIPHRHLAGLDRFRTCSAQTPRTCAQ